MRVLCVTNLFPNPFQPGKGLFNLRQLRLMSRQIDLRVVSPILWIDEWRGRRAGGKPFCERRWRNWDGVSVAYCTYYYTPKVGRRFYGTAFEWSIRRLFRWAARDFHPDLIYACWAYPDGWAARHLANEFDLPCVVKIHGSDLLLLDEFPARRAGTLDLLRHADATLSVGQVLRDRAVALGAPPEQAFVVREGTDGDHFRPGDRSAARQNLGLPAQRRRLLFVGNLVEVKAVPQLVDACARLVNAGHDLELDILGDGPLSGGLSRQISECGLAGRAHLRGRKTQQELPAWYAASDLVVLPSYSEGVPNVLVEAAACGRPFVATAVGGVPEIAHLTSAKLVPSGDSAALANEITAVLANPARRNFVADRALVPLVPDGVARTLNIFSGVLEGRQVAQPAQSELQIAEARAV